MTKGATSERDEYYVSFFWFSFLCVEGGTVGRGLYADECRGDTETYGQGPRRLGAEEGGEVEGRAGREIVIFARG